MNDNELTGPTEKMIQEVVDRIMEGIEAASSDKELRKYVEKGRSLTEISNGWFAGLK